MSSDAWASEINNYMPRRGGLLVGAIWSGAICPIEIGHMTGLNKQ